ncbi:hypothetical protein [Chitinophaga filiformis]|uniref:Uncharacterized protein n=1 Tax=Chitinophaga filiformis TaxID=104663 RepID=A0A1G7MFI4_CHIFI|nr:hypothetical protein [Chitinophaga filiformis]SDF60487.1 hypothetical protein SAMN04488121_102405 [Chitinophaga filiformis]
MSKAKAILATVLFAGGIGAIFAFKARNTDIVFVPSTTAATTECTSIRTGLTIGQPLEQGTFTIKATLNSAQPCGVLTVKPGA